MSPVVKGMMEGAVRWWAWMRVGFWCLVIGGAVGAGMGWWVTRETTVDEKDGEVEGNESDSGLGEGKG